MKNVITRAAIVFIIQAGLFYFVFSQLSIKEGMFTVEKRTALFFWCIASGAGMAIFDYFMARYDQRAIAKRKSQSNTMN